MAFSYVTYLYRVSNLIHTDRCNGGFHADSAAARMINCQSKDQLMKLIKSILRNIKPLVPNPSLTDYTLAFLCPVYFSTHSTHQYINLHALHALAQVSSAGKIQKYAEHDVSRTAIGNPSIKRFRHLVPISTAVNNYKVSFSRMVRFTPNLSE